MCCSCENEDDYEIEYTWLEVIESVFEQYLPPTPVSATRKTLTEMYKKLYSNRDILRLAGLPDGN